MKVQQQTVGREDDADLWIAAGMHRADLDAQDSKVFSTPIKLQALYR